MVNYQLGHIYRLESDQTDKIYIGSTCQELRARLSNHKSNARQYLDRKYGYRYMSSAKIAQYNDVRIVLIEDFPFDCRKQLSIREDYHMDQNEDIIVNEREASTGLYRQKYKHKYPKYPEKILCDKCGKIIKRCNRPLHKRTKSCIAAPFQIILSREGLTVGDECVYNRLDTIMNLPN